jgi:S1-C subfamily serine protease
MTTEALSLSTTLSTLVSTTAASVVRVDARRRGPASGAAWSAGVVVTAAHVLERDSDIELGLPDGRTVPATVAGVDPGTDLAVLKADTDGLVVPDWSDRASSGHAVPDAGAQVGALVLAVGRPGRTARAALGIIAAHGEAWRTHHGSRVDQYLENDLRLFPGYSGGLVIDGGGRVLGLGTAGLERGAALTLPVSTVRRVVTQLLEKGRVQRAFLGVGTYPARLGGEQARALGQPGALLVVSVAPDSPAAAAGVLLGDALLAVDGAPIRHVGELVDRLDAERIGTVVSVRVLRAGEVREIPVTLGGR